MKPSGSQSFWRKILGRPEDPAAAPKSAEYDRYVKPETQQVKPPAQDPAGAAGMSVSDAVKGRRFETVAFTMAAQGKAVDAEEVGDRALEEGKYGQAVRIFTRIEAFAKAAHANEMAASDCLKRGGSKKLVASRLHDAIQAYAKQVTRKGEDHVGVLNKMVAVSGQLAEILAEAEDNLGSGDTWLYRARLCHNLLPDAAIAATLGDSARRAMDAYRSHVNAHNISPEADEGKAIIEKLKTAQKLIDSVTPAS